MFNYFLIFCKYFISNSLTLNRWLHGYAYEYMELDDPEWEEGQAPHEIYRAQFGRISIANSDSEAYAYVNATLLANHSELGGIEPPY